MVGPVVFTVCYHIFFQKETFHAAQKMEFSMKFSTSLLSYFLKIGLTGVCLAFSEKTFIYVIIDRLSRLQKFLLFLVEFCQD